jgi:hypothetical protein
MAKKVRRASDYLGNRTAWFWNDPAVRPFDAAVRENIVPLHLNLDDIHERHEIALRDPFYVAKLTEANKVREAARAGKDVDTVALRQADALLLSFVNDLADVGGKLADAHRDIGDDDGADFWQFWSDFRGRPYYDNGMWWFDNQMIKPSESYFRIPFAAVWLFHKGLVRLPAADGPYFAEQFDDDNERAAAVRADEDFQADLVRAAEEAEREADQDRDNPELARRAAERRWDAMRFQPIGWDTTRPSTGEAITRAGFHGRVCAETTLLAAWRQMLPAERAAAAKGDFEYLDRSREG